MTDGTDHQDTNQDDRSAFDLIEQARDIAHEARFSGAPPRPTVHPADDRSGRSESRDGGFSRAYQASESSRANRANKTTVRPNGGA